MSVDESVWLYLHKNENKIEVKRTVYTFVLKFSKILFTGSHLTRGLVLGRDLQAGDAT